jgi:hypothetical protein
MSRIYKIFIDIFVAFKENIKNGSKKKSVAILFNNLFMDKTDNTSLQFFRSLFVGGIATVADMGVLAILTKLFLSMIT